MFNSTESLRVFYVVNFLLFFYSLLYLFLFVFLYSMLETQFKKQNRKVKTLLFKINDIFDIFDDERIQNLELTLMNKEIDNTFNRISSS